MTDRRTSRIVALQALYAKELSEVPAGDILKHVIKPKLKGDTSAFRFAESLFLKTNNNREELDAILSNHTKNWSLDRLATLDRLLLRMATAELLHFEQIPTKVTINEAIEIAKDYSTKRSGSFINGILDSILADLKQQGRIEKEGRGLIET